MNMSGLFVFKVPGKDEWIAYDGRVSANREYIKAVDREVVCKTPIKLGVFDTEADAWLCVNELQRKDKDLL